EWDGPAIFIEVEVGLATVDVKVRAADADGSRLDPDIVWAEVQRWNIDQFEPAGGRDCTGAHHGAAV
ncbi:MAG: hypothetical protein ACJA0V_004747, partial [Planctomycetota bacterium]